MRNFLTLLIIALLASNARAQASSAQQCPSDSLVAQYWAATDFSDENYPDGNSALKTRFFDFIKLFPEASVEARKSGIADFYTRSLKATKTAQYIGELIDEEVGDPIGDLYNEDYYRTFLNVCIATEALPDWQRERAEYQLEMVSKNLPGTYTADFGMVLREGGAAALYRLIDPDRLNLLIIYSQYCSDCAEVKAKIAADPVFDNVNIIAVSDTGDYDSWKASADDMPKTWHVGFTGGQIEDKGLYYIQLIPALYLLDQKGIVLIKNAKLEQLINYISR